MKIGKSALDKLNDFKDVEKLFDIFVKFDFDSLDKDGFLKKFVEKKGDKK